MEVSKPPVWFFLMVGVFVLVLIYFFFKTFGAKTQKSFVGYFALTMLLGMVAATITTNSGFIRLPDPGQLPPHAPRDALTSVPWQVIVAGLLSICGGNYIMARQARKAGLSWWEALNPFSPPLRYMDGGAWAKVLLLAIVALGFARWGIVQTPKDAVRHDPTALSQPGRN